MDAKELLLRDHARAHGPGVGEPEGGLFMGALLLNDVTDEQARMKPAEGVNSLAWILWHMARSEDLGVNLIVAGQPQVIDGDGWVDRLGLSRTDIGTGMNDDEVADFTNRVNLNALKEYRNAVGRRTREVVQELRPEEWTELQDAGAMQRVAEAGAIGENAQWMASAFGGKSKALILSHTCVAHSFWHLGEGVTVRSLVGAKLNL
jgi:hypothetical protein